LLWKQKSYQNGGHYNKHFFCIKNIIVPFYTMSLYKTMSDSMGIEMEPPMHLQRPSPARSQDVSHILASVFREVFTRDVVGEQTVKHLATSRSGEEGYHDKYVRQLQQVWKKN
jgi:hypothetical protein